MNQIELTQNVVQIGGGFLKAKNCCVSVSKLCSANSVSTIYTCTQRVLHIYVDSTYMCTCLT